MQIKFNINYDRNVHHKLVQKTINLQKLFKTIGGLNYDLSNIRAIKSHSVRSLQLAFAT